MPEIANYVSHGGSQITPLVVEKVLRHIPRWKMEFTQIEDARFPHLVQQLEFLANAVEDFAEGVEKELPYVAVAQAVFALMYAHRQMDIIPDFVAKLGHADDSSIVRAALIQNEKAFARYAQKNKADWSRISSKP